MARVALVLSPVDSVRTGAGEWHRQEVMALDGEASDVITHKQTVTHSHAHTHATELSGVKRLFPMLAHQIFPLHRGSSSSPGPLWVWYSLCFRTGFIGMYLCMRGCIFEQCKKWLQMEYIRFFYWCCVWVTEFCGNWGQEINKDIHFGIHQLVKVKLWNKSSL